MGKKRILIIEDEKDLVVMLRMRLEAAGFDVISAQDGQTGLEAARGMLPDLVILDVVMPLLDGYQVCRELRKGDATRKISVIILTASGVKNIIQRCFDAGANFCMRKPFDSEQLISKIKELLQID